MRLAYRLAAFVHHKTKKWIHGRRDWEKDLSQEMSSWPEGLPRVWMHCSSLGEFEQGRPILEAIREQYPHYRILLTFFSPSGYELRKDYAGADHVCYLPADTMTSARLFVDITRPDLVIFVKYDFWYNHLIEVQKRNIPLILVSALFRPDQVFFTPYGKWFAGILGGFSLIFTQNESSRQQLQQISVDVQVAGDTRVDRVVQIAKEARTFPNIAHWATADRLLIGGSTWPEDEAILQQWWEQQQEQEKWQLILAPHDISEKHLQQIEQLFGTQQVIRYSQLTAAAREGVLLIDNIGMLSSIYRYGYLAYIGGGFGAGIHNTLEPIAHEIPVIFGPRYHKFEEAKVLIAAGGGFSIDSVPALIATMHKLDQAEPYYQAQEAASGYIRQNQGATTSILQALQDKGWLNRPV